MWGESSSPLRSESSGNVDGNEPTEMRVLEQSTGTGSPSSPPLERGASLSYPPTAVLVDDPRSSSIVRAERTAQRSLHEMYSEMTEKELSMRQRLYHIFHGTPALELDYVLSVVYNIFQLFLVLLTTIVLIVQSLPQYYRPDTRVSSDWGFILESVTVVFFTLDYIVRVGTARSWSFLIHPTTIVDFASILGYYLELIIFAAGNVRSSVVFQILRFIRVARITRLFKLSRLNKGLALMAEVIIASNDGIFLLVVLVCIATLFFSSLLYYAERTGSTFDNDNNLWIRNDGTISPFQSIPGTFWFVLSTTTTVGYGDTVPYSLLGKVVAIFVMLFGVLVLSFPNILIGSNFQAAHDASVRVRARRTLGTYFRRVRMVVRFIRLWREFRVTGRVRIFREPSMHSPNPESPDDLERRSSSKEFALTLRATNFIARATDFSYVPESAAAKKLEKGNLEAIHKGISFLNFLQRLLEGFSGVCSVNEMTESYLFYPFAGRKCRRETVFEMTAILSAFGILSFFVLNRHEQTGLMFLTRKGLDLLLNYTEGDPMPCVRNHADARSIWTQTTKLKCLSFLPLDGYRSWQEIQETVPRRSFFEFVHDFKKPESKRNHLFEKPPPHHSRFNSNAAASKRNLRDSWVTPSTGLPDIVLSTTHSTDPPKHMSPTLRGAAEPCHCTHCSRLRRMTTQLEQEDCFQVDEEYLEMQVRLAQQALDLYRLRQTASRVLPQHPAHASALDATFVGSEPDEVVFPPVVGADESAALDQFESGESSHGPHSMAELGSRSSARGASHSAASPPAVSESGPAEAPAMRSEVFRLPAVPSRKGGLIPLAAVESMGPRARRDSSGESPSISLLRPEQ